MLFDSDIQVQRLYFPTGILINRGVSLPSDPTMTGDSGAPQRQVLVEFCSSRILSFAAWRHFAGKYATDMRTNGRQLKQNSPD
jgi:hypothetical protein